MSDVRELEFEEDDEDEEITEEDEASDIDAIKAKFSILATALQETNQNLVAYELLQEHYR